MLTPERSYQTCAHTCAAETHGQRAVNEGCFLGGKKQDSPSGSLVLHYWHSTSGTTAASAAPLDGKTGSAPLNRRLLALTRGQAGDPKERTAHLAGGQKDTACTAAALLYDSGLQISETPSFPWAHAAPGGIRTARNHVAFL